MHRDVDLRALREAVETGIRLSGRVGRSLIRAVVGDQRLSGLERGLAGSILHPHAPVVEVAHVHRECESHYRHKTQTNGR